MGKWLWLNAFFQKLPTQLLQPKMWYTLMWSCWLTTREAKRGPRRTLRHWQRGLASMASARHVVLLIHGLWSLPNRDPSTNFILLCSSQSCGFFSAFFSLFLFFTYFEFQIQICVWIYCDNNIQKFQIPTCFLYCFSSVS